MKNPMHPAVSLGLAPDASAVLVSASRHAEVYVCNARQWVGSSPIDPLCERVCIKVLHGRRAYVQYQLMLLERLRDASQANAITCARGHCMPPVLEVSRLVEGSDLSLGEYEDALRIVTPWIEGHPLSQLIAALLPDCSRASLRVSLGSALSLLSSVAWCVHSISTLMEEAAIVHGDIKPSNIVLTGASETSAVLIDYDTAVFLGDADIAAPCGTLGYAAPECVLGGAACATATSDVFSFGILACEVLTGRWPYSLSSITLDNRALWQAYFRMRRKPEISSALPSDVREFLEACVLLDARARPSVAQAASEIEELSYRYANSTRMCPLTASRRAPVQSTPSWSSDLPPALA